MSTIHFNPNQDGHSSSPSFFHLHPYDEVIGDEALGRKKEINDLKFTILKSYNNNNNHHQYGNYNNDYYHNNGTSSSSSSAKIESPKMRLYRKFMSSNDNDDQRIEDQNLKQDDDVSPRESCGENTTNNIRICADCGTTKTPLWRGGPHGPKSLCNACGIRQRKARRAAMAASDTTCATNNKLNNNNLVPNKDMGFSPKMKKRSKNRSKKPLLTPNIDDDKTTTTTTQTKKICFQEFSLNLSNKLSLHQFFPQDEKEAAILLMALSSGFVEG